MVRNYGYENMNEFLLTFKECQTAYMNYQRDVDNREKAYDNPEAVSEYQRVFRSTGSLT